MRTTERSEGCARWIRDMTTVDLSYRHGDSAVSRGGFVGLARYRDQREVDIVVEHRDGSGAATVTFGDRLAAVPLSGLWSP